MMEETELKYIKNSGLFSRHYLQNILPKRVIWKDTQKAESVFNKIKSLFNANWVFLSSSPNEAQLRDKILNDILEILGHYYQVEGKVEKSAKHPDYGLFADEKSSQEAIALQGKEDFYKKAITICEAKGWEVSLDKNVKGKPTFANENPSFQVDSYLRETTPRWAILTNGRYWRLYYQETSYKPENYFEVDLGEIIDKDCFAELKYFYLLFRREAFIPDSQDVCFLDDVYNESISYAKELGENVQENVYKAMKTLAEGFISFSENKLSLTDDEKVNNKTLREVQENTMKLLYRLLFIFYAEAGGLLDIKNKSYRDSYSLDSLKKIIRNQITRGHTISQYTTIHWTKLQDLFRLIDKGLKIPEDNLFIPAYNGGLFDPKRNKFLKEKRVGDYFVAKAIDFLATSKSKDDSEKGFVDYSSLDIRHLGAIYEGLLEYKLKRAEEPMIAIRKSKKELWIPELEFKGKKYMERVDAGELYLATDKGERKATGSYYTPDYIVEYIVKNTIGPIVEEKIKQAKKEGKSTCDAILSAKILDPAMGSGHFLVEVVDFLTRPLLNAVSKDIERGIIEGKEVTTEWAKREIAAHCIYGVDLNPMAVELAKVSLWLKTIAKDKPLSFLDHRLKLGNSLMGANLSELRNYPDLKKKKKEIDKDQQQFEVVIPQIFIDRLLKKTREIESIQDETLEDTKRKEEIFAELKKTDAYIKTLAIANVHTAVYFGNEVGTTSTKDKKGVYYQLISTLDFPKDWQWLSKKEWFIRAQKIAEERRFFHWELEFPEIFFEKGKRKDNPGFDAVVGNPPYVTLALGKGQEELDKFEGLYLRSTFPESSEYKTNTYALFTDQGLQLIGKSSLLGFILPKTILTNYYLKKFRKKLLDEINIRNITLIDEKVFEEAEIGGNSILIAGTYENGYILVSELDDNKKFHMVTEIDQKQFLDVPDYKFLFNSEIIKLFKKIQSISKTVGQIAVLYNGIKTGDNKKFLSKSKDTEKHRKVLRGRDINRYLLTFGGLYVYFDKDQLWSNTNEKMFEASPKVIVRQTGESLTAAYDNSKYYTMDTTHLIIPRVKVSALYLLTIINSKLENWYYHQIVPEVGKAFAEVKIVNLEKLPIRYISFKTEIEKLRKIVESLILKYKSGSYGEILDDVEGLLLRDKNGNFITGKEKSDVVHDILAFLAEQMIEINKRKHKEIKGFLDWIERQIGVPIEDLSLKTYLKEYDEHAFNDLLRVMRQNKNKIQPDPDSREFQETLKKEYDASIAKLKPLKEKIEKTDRLIDQIVYNLYGLTDEEIEIVEESLKGGLA
jgi:hypothetical protein